MLLLLLGEIDGGLPLGETRIIFEAAEFAAGDLVYGTHGTELAVECSDHHIGKPPLSKLLVGDGNEHAADVGQGHAMFLWCSKGNPLAHFGQLCRIHRE